MTSYRSKSRKNCETEQSGIMFHRRSFTVFVMLFVFLIS